MYLLTLTQMLLISKGFFRGYLSNAKKVGWLFWTAETTSKDGQKGWLNLNMHDFHEISYM